MRHMAGKLLVIALAVSLLATLPMQIEGLSREDICHNCQRVLGFVHDHYKTQTTRKSIQHKIRHLCNRYFDYRQHCIRYILRRVDDISEDLMRHAREQSHAEYKPRECCTKIGECAN